MKIAIVSHDFPPFGFGGVGSYAYDLASALSNKNIDVTVFCGAREKIKKELKVKFKIVRLKMLNLPPHSFWFQLQNLSFLKKELKKYDLVIGQSTSFGLICLYKNSIKKPLITVFHGTPLSELKSFMSSSFKDWTFDEFVYSILEYPLYHLMNLIEIKKSDHIVSVGYSILENIKKEFSLKRKYSVIQNGVNVERINKLLKNVKSNNNKTRIIFYGRLYYRKGLTFLLDAMKIVVKKFRNVELNIYGDGPLESSSIKFIRENNLGQNIKLNGFIKNEDLIKDIGKSDIVVLPSLYEAFSIAYLEAMACKKPLIVFDYPFSRELITNMKNGILARKKDINDLNNKIILVIKDKKLRNRIGQNAYNNVCNSYNSKSIVNKYVKLFNKIVK